MLSFRAAKQTDKPAWAARLRHRRLQSCPTLSLQAWYTLDEERHTLQRNHAELNGASEAFRLCCLARRHSSIDPRPGREASDTFQSSRFIQFISMGGFLPASTVQSALHHFFRGVRSIGPFSWHVAQSETAGTPQMARTSCACCNTSSLATPLRCPLLSGTSGH